MFCVKCGAKVAPNQSFCNKCGFPQSNEVELVTNEVEQVKEELITAEESKNKELRLAEELKKGEKGFGVVLLIIIIGVIGSVAVSVVIGGLLSLPESTQVECGEKYWDSDREKYVRKKC